MMGYRRSGVVMALCLMGALAIGGEARASTNMVPAGVVNLNTATVEQLKLLPAIGAKRARRIVSFRQLKPFKRVVELARVRGIGLKTVRKLKPYLAIEGPTTLSRRP